MPDKNNSARLRYRLHYFLALILLVHSLFYLLYWFAVGRFRLEVDRFLEDWLSFSLSYTTILMVLTAFLGLWSLFRFIGLRLTLSRRHQWTPSPLNWVYGILSLLFLIVFYGSYVMILRESPSQKGVLVHLLNLVRVLSDALVFLYLAGWLRRLILYLRRRSARANRKWFWAIAIILVLVGLIGLWLVPTLFPPNWTYQGDLPTRPALIAHRGASMLAPENTLAAIELASVMQALGFETDIRISQDGVPFLMHDAFLTRTTNIAEVFPDRVGDRASSFTIEAIKQLNAGLWFIQKDPFDTINAGLVSQAQLSTNQGQKIPTLEEALDLVEKNDLVFLFDMRYPPEDHPYHSTFFEIVFETLRESGLNGDIWLLLDQDRLQIVLNEAPQMTRVAGISSTDLPDPDALVEAEYEIVNVDSGITNAEIAAYRERGLGVNVYTVDETWLFSQFWLAGVTSITTNNVHTFSQLDGPFLAVPYNQFLLIWSIFGFVVAIWLAASQPQPEHPEETREPPDLLDFAGDAEDTVDTSQPAAPDQDEVPDEDSSGL
jgi:glycerophosphoryl diester phosphodiesterase